jgi:hypothetical protein
MSVGRSEYVRLLHRESVDAVVYLLLLLHYPGHEFYSDWRELVYGSLPHALFKIRGSGGARNPTLKFLEKELYQRFLDSGECMRVFSDYVKSAGFGWSSSFEVGFDSILERVRGIMHDFCNILYADGCFGFDRFDAVLKKHYL